MNALISRARSHCQLYSRNPPRVDHAAIDFQIDLVEMPSRGFGQRLRRSAAILGPKWFT
jgi:hypothetical protein